MLPSLCHSDHCEATEVVAGAVGVDEDSHTLQAVDVAKEGVTLEDELWLHTCQLLSLVVGVAVDDELCVHGPQLVALLEGVVLEELSDQACLQ